MKSNLSRTMIVCGLLLGALLIVILLAAVIGSQRLPLKASVCALIGVDCGLSSEQPQSCSTSACREFFSPAGWNLSGNCGSGISGFAAESACGTIPARRFEWRSGGNDDGAGFLWRARRSRPVFAFAGALIASFVVYQLARGRAGATPDRLVLAGVSSPPFFLRRSFSSRL